MTTSMIYVGYLGLIILGLWGLLVIFNKFLEGGKTMFKKKVKPEGEDKNYTEEKIEVKAEEKKEAPAKAEEKEEGLNEGDLNHVEAGLWNMIVGIHKDIDTLRKELSELKKLIEEEIKKSN